MTPIFQNFYSTLLLFHLATLSKNIRISGRVLIPYGLVKEAHFPLPQQLTFHGGNEYLKVYEEKQVMLKLFPEQN